MELPIYENDRPAGSLQVSRQGLYTIFRARLPKPAVPELTRLWLRGADGTAVPLGLLEPGEDGRRLCRRLSRLDLRRLPPAPVCALALPADARPAPGSGPQTAPPPSAEKASPEAENASPWRRCPDGSLFDPARRLLALPWGGGTLPAGVRKISLGGREYLVFRT